MVVLIGCAVAGAERCREVYADSLRIPVLQDTFHAPDVRELGPVVKGYAQDFAGHHQELAQSALAEPSWHRITTWKRVLRSMKEKKTVLLPLALWTVSPSQWPQVSLSSADRGRSAPCRPSPSDPSRLILLFGKRHFANCGNGGIVKCWNNVKCHYACFFLKARQLIRKYKYM